MKTIYSYLKTQLKNNQFATVEKSRSGSTYINYNFGTEENEQDGHQTSFTIRFSDHKRPSYSTNACYSDHEYLTDIRVHDTISTSFIDAVLIYCNELVKEGLSNIEKENYYNLYWEQSKLIDITDDIKISNQWSNEQIKL